MSFHREFHRGVKGSSSLGTTPRCLRFSPSSGFLVPLRLLARAESAKSVRAPVLLGAFEHSLMELGGEGVYGPEG